MIISAAFNLNAQSDSLFLSPSAYYTHGFYSDNKNSDAVSIYNTVELAKNYYLINHFDQLLINQNEWDYKQNTFLAGGLVYLFPFFVKMNYAHYKGDYSAKGFDYSYSDFTNLYNVDISFYTDSWYLGSSYMHSNLIGFYALQTNQLTFRIEKIISLLTFLSVKPTYIRTNDNRDFFSVYAKFHYQVSDEILLKLGGFIGDRINYFDSDLLTFFNQEEVQKYQVFTQGDYDILKWLRLTASYQLTEFENFRINYIVLGIKSMLYF